MDCGPLIRGGFWEIVHLFEAVRVVDKKKFSDFSEIFFTSFDNFQFLRFSIQLSMRSKKCLLRLEIIIRGKLYDLFFNIQHSYILNQPRTGN